MTDIQNTTDANPQAVAAAAENQDAAARLVPVAESIKYRRRAQQAEGRVGEFEQRLTQLQQELERRAQELAAAESQRDEARVQLVVTENRMTAERMLSQAGVVDVEAAWLLLGRRLDASEPLDQQELAQQVEGLLLDKPYLRSQRGSMPGKTAGARSPQANVRSMLAGAAQQALVSGDRRDVAEYLRLRRTAARN